MEQQKKLETRHYRVRSTPRSFVGDLPSNRSMTKIGSTKRIVNWDKGSVIDKEKLLVRNNYISNFKLRSRMANNTYSKIDLRTAFQPTSKVGEESERTGINRYQSARESATHIFKFKPRVSVMIQNVIHFSEAKFKLLDKAEIKLIISQITFNIEQMKEKFASAPPFKVLLLYQSVLDRLGAIHEKLKYIFFESKSYIHNRSKANIKRILLLGLFANFKDWLELDENSSFRYPFREGNFDLSFFKNLLTFRILLNEKLNDLQDAKIRTFKDKSQKLINNLNSVYNENMYKTYQVNPQGFPTSKETDYKPKKLEMLAGLGKFIEVDACFGNANSSPNSRFGKSWHHNKKLRMFLNDLALTMSSQYDKLS